MATQSPTELDTEVARIINQQVANGWKLDEQLCMELLAEIADGIEEAEEAVHARFRPTYRKLKEVHPKRNKDGSTSKVGISFLGEDCLDIVGGHFTRVDCVDFNLGSRQQIGEYLLRYGWQPTAFTPTGQPVVSETVLEDVDIPEAQVIAHYLTLEKRQAMIRSWLDFLQPDGRVHGKVDPLGAVTTRMTHSEPNVAQVTAKGKLYGAEMRRCWTVEPGYKLVGCDADGLELRMLAHYMADEAYVQTVCHGTKEDGTDAHTVTQKAAGLETRDQAKTLMYAFLYGAGDAKIGSIIGGSRKEGKRLKARLLRGIPALKSLRDRVEKAAAKGYLRSLDGRHISIRHSHAALNTLLQGGGAVLMKQAMVFVDKMATDAALDFKLVGSVHDELQYEVHEDDAEMMAAFAERGIKMAGEHFELRCPMTGTATIGNTWEATH